MKLKSLFFGVAGLVLAVTAQAQVKIGNNPTTINPSAALEVESTNKGVLPPRLTTPQRDVITNPATGLVVYNTTENCLQINMGTPTDPDWQCSSNRSGSGGTITRFSDTRPYAFANRDGAGAYNTIPNQEVMIPLCNYNFNTTIGGTLTLTFSAFIDSRTAAGTWTHQEYRLYIDNVLVGTQSFEHNDAEAASISITGFRNIIPGAHTVDLRAYRLNGVGTNGALGVYGSSYYASIQ